MPWPIRCVVKLDRQPVQFLHVVVQAELAIQQRQEQLFDTAELGIGGDCVAGELEARLNEGLLTSDLAGDVVVATTVGDAVEPRSIPMKTFMLPLPSSAPASEGSSRSGS